jgi:hypothetical protein
MLGSSTDEPIRNERLHDRKPFELAAVNGWFSSNPKVGSTFRRAPGIDTFQNIDPTIHGVSK